MPAFCEPSKAYLREIAPLYYYFFFIFIFMSVPARGYKQPEAEIFLVGVMESCLGGSLL